MLAYEDALQKRKKSNTCKQNVCCHNEIMFKIFDFSTQDSHIFCDLWELLTNSLFSFSGCTLLDFWVLGF